MIFSIDQKHFKSEYNNALPENTKESTPVTPNIDFW